MARSHYGTALVTGSSGFIGSHLVARLAREGCSVVGFDSAPPPDAVAESVRAVTADVRDEAALRRVFTESRPEVVYHLAAQASVAVSMREPTADIETNVLGTVRVAQAAAEAGVRRFVFFSTGGALCGEPERVPVDEQTPMRPASVYGASKLAAESYLRVLSAESGCELSVVRPGNVYGPGQNAQGEAGVIAIFAARMLHDEAVTIFGDGSQSRDYVHVDDVVEAALSAATEEPATCLIGTGIATRTMDVFESLSQACGYDRRPIFAEERPGDIQRIVLDASRARSVWGWTPRVPFDAGVAATADWFRGQASAR